MNSMRRLLAIVLLTLLTAGSLPSLAQARLICRMTGVEMQPVAVKDDPRSCCAIREKSSGGAELANRSCCDLKITPGHAPLPDATTATVSTDLATLPTIALSLPIPALVATALPSTPPGAPRYRGPPPSPASPRGPPTLS